MRVARQVVAAEMCNILISRSITIRNSQGLHARPAQLLAQLATKYQSRIELVRESQRVDAKSIFNLLTLAAAQGTALTLEAEGCDAEEAADAIMKLVENEFGVEELKEAQAPGAADVDRSQPEQA